MAPRVRVKKPRSALKHGGYSTMGLLPGENPAEYENLRENLIDEFAPVGPLEEDVVCTIARLLWRKQNLSTLRMAEWATGQRSQIIEEEKARRKIPESDPLIPTFEILEFEDAEVQAARKDAVEAGEKQARDKLGQYYELTQRDYHATALMEDLGVEERLDGAIDKCIKRLLMIRGVKSVSVQAPSQPTHLPKPRSSDHPAA